MLLFWISVSAAQQPYSQNFERGKLWHSYYISQECEPMMDWQRKAYGLDWPGYNTEELKQNIGGSNSYLSAGGFYIMTLTDSGRTLGWADFACHGRDVDWTLDKRYKITKHEKITSNHWLKNNPAEAEELITTEWEKNSQWYEISDNLNLPIRVTRTARQWSGSQADENYIITEYIIRNTLRRDTLKGVCLLFTWAVAPNHRGWNLCFPTYPDGARNTRSYYDAQKQMVVAYAGDFNLTTQTNESYDYYEYLKYDPVTQKNVKAPEYIAPGYMGIRFLYISPDSTGQENHIRSFCWSAGSPSNDQGPFESILGLDNKYASMRDPKRLTRAFDDPNDSRMGQNRLFTNFAIGPFYIPRNDSIRIVVAEFVGGISYEQAIDTMTTPAMIAAAGDSAIDYLSQRVKFNFEHQYRVPMPPPAPSFTVSSFNDPGKIGNVIQFTDSSERVPDPHAKTVDIQGYRIYRSNYLPFGPWEKIAEIGIKETPWYHADSARYQFVDTLVALGYGYYYSITAFDKPDQSWAVDPAVTVPSLESSIFANRKPFPFYTTLIPTAGVLDRVTVVPNPFYRSSGLSLAGDTKLIQFVNLASECTIRIFTLRGDLVKTFNHKSSQSGVTGWNQISDYGQYVKSGIYLYVITTPGGTQKNGKFAIIN